MANTRMTAPNTFTKGLVMDFNPTITKSDSLVNALNATLLTFNGNEMQLQQDMGNGRVETAFLPQGYVPVGACEFGDIIYIVSYNPLENKSQIGCFPSPERNITEEEIINTTQQLKSEDFQDFKGGNLTGIIKSLSVKKVMHGNKNLNPGDKFIIYTKEKNPLTPNKNNLSDFGNTSHRHNEWPKLVKLKIVSIEDSGKIVDLNASVKWYNNHYYLTEEVQNNNGKPDIDSYRSLVSSAYSIFQSKVSGKLALLAELETIQSFSCTYDVFTTNDEKTHETKYNIYFYTSWETNHNDVNPSGFIFTQSNWAPIENSGYIYKPKVINENNTQIISYEKYSVQTKLPIKSAATISNNQVVRYDAEQIKAYSRTYELEQPSKDFKTYITEASYNAKISNILDWFKVNNTYEAIKDNSKYSILRPVTRLNRLLDLKTGEPVIEDNKGKYLYNLDYYSTKINEDKSQTITYQTKDINGKYVDINPISLNDDVVNNYFHKDIATLVAKDFPVLQKQEVTIKEKPVLVNTNLSNLIWDYKVAPVMPYGVLEHLEVQGQIDFSKLGTGTINLNTWKYYNSGNVSTLTWGLEAYSEPNKGIAEVVFDFYDNQGCAASYHITGKSSYAGIFTEQIILGQQNSSYKLNAINAENKSYFHAGINDPKGKIYFTDSNTPTLEPTNKGPFKNDAGTLYPNVLYLVKITVKYCPKDLMGNYSQDNVSNYKYFYRWFWSNGMFNDMYYNTSDFINLQPKLYLDFSGTFNTKGSKGLTTINPLIPKHYIYTGPSTFNYSQDKNELYKTLSANVYTINQDYADDKNGNIQLILNPGLTEGYNTFNLNKDKLDLITNIKVIMGKSSITKNIENPSLIHTGDSFISVLDDIVQPVIAQNLTSYDKERFFDRSGYAGHNYGTNECHVSNYFLKLVQHSESAERTNVANYTGDKSGTGTGSSDTEMFTNLNAYQAYLDAFSLNIIGGQKNDDKNKQVSYLDKKGETQVLDVFQMKICPLSEASDLNKGIPLVLAGTAFSKTFAAEMHRDKHSKILKSIISSLKDDAKFNSLKYMGLHLYQNHLYFNDLITFYMGESTGHPTHYGSFNMKGITDNGWKSTNHGGGGRNNHNNWGAWLGFEDIQSLWRPHISSPVSAFVIGRHGGSSGNVDSLYSNLSWDKIRTSFDLGAKGHTIYSKSYEIPFGDPSNWIKNDGGIYFYCFIVYDQAQNMYVPISDYFRGDSNSLTQNKQSMDQNKDKVPTQTLADMLGSLFAQLYVVDPSSEGNTGLLSNFVSLQNYSEFWNKDIIIEADTTNLTNQETLRELITIQNQTMQKYLSALKLNCKENYVEDKINSNNVTINLYGTQRVFAFEFEVPYNLGNLPYLNAQKSEPKNKIFLTVLENDTPKVEVFSGQVASNTLYTWTGTNIIPFGSGSLMYYASSFKDINGELYMTASKETIKRTSFEPLSKVLQYNNGDITWNNLSQFPTWNSTYTLNYECGNQDPELKGIPIVSFFNLYKPGL